MNYGRWYGFDLDGTIADDSAHTFWFGTIGAPIVPMTDLMRRLHQEGKRVKIFTARLSDVGQDAECRAQLCKHIWEWDLAGCLRDFMVVQANAIGEVSDKLVQRSVKILSQCP